MSSAYCDCQLSTIPSGDWIVFLSAKGGEENGLGGSYLAKPFTSLCEVLPFSLSASSSELGLLPTKKATNFR